MLKTRTLWLFAGACLCLALGIAWWRYAEQQRSERELDALYAVYDEALALLEEDPTASRLDTQRALRRAAVQADDGLLPTADGFYLLAQQLVREADYAAAEAMFLHAAEAAPHWAYPHAALGRMLARNAVGRAEVAREHLQQAIDLDPEYWDPYDSLSILARLEGKLDEAKTHAERAVELAPQQAGPHNNLANLLVSMEQYEEAEQEYRAAIALDPGNAKPYYNLACLYAIRGNKDGAFAQLKAAIERDPALKMDAVEDPDLKLLRKETRFKKLTAQPSASAKK